MTAIQKFPNAQPTRVRLPPYLASSSYFGFWPYTFYWMSRSKVIGKEKIKKHWTWLAPAHFSFRLLVNDLGRAFSVDSPHTNEGSSLRQLPFEKLNFTLKYRLFSRIVDNTQSMECIAISAIHPEKFLLCKLKRLFHLLGWSTDWVLCGVACCCFKTLS